MYHYIVTSIKRQRNRSILVVLVNAVLVILLNLYFILIGSYRTQLNDLAANTPIHCGITNPDGSIEVGIAVADETIVALQAAAQVKELDCSTQLKAGFGEFEKAYWNGNLNLDVSVVNRSDSQTLPEGIKTEYMAGWDESLFAGNERVCVLKKSDMEEQGISPGDEIPFTFYYYVLIDERQDVDILRLGYVNLKVVGLMDDTDPVESSDYPDMMMPLEAVREIFAEKQIPFTAEAVSFQVKDPLALNAFKAEMREIGLLEIYQGAAAKFSYKGTALYVRDGNFITMAGRLQTAIRILTAFLLPMGILILIVGYVVSHLLASGRVTEFALFRSLGQGKLSAAAVLWAEQMCLSLAGVVCGSLLSMLAGRLLLQEVVCLGGAVFGGYLLGATAAFVLLAVKTPLQLLVMNE